MASGMTGAVGEWVRSRPRLFGAVAIALSLGLPGHAVAQTPRTLAAADRLIAVQKLGEMMKDMAVNVSTKLPDTTEMQKQAFVAEMTDPAFLARYQAQVRVAFARHLTVEEMDALSDFYSKPIAAAAMKKMGATTAELMTFIQAEIPAMVARIMKKP
jgi:uncharacterized protein